MYIRDFDDRSDIKNILKYFSSSIITIFIKLAYLISSRYNLSNILHSPSTDKIEYKRIKFIKNRKAYKT